MTGRYLTEDKINLRTLKTNDQNLRINQNVKQTIESIVGIELTDSEVKEIIYLYALVNPLSLNPYIYVFNNPNIYHDEDGNLPPPAIAAGVIAAGLAVWAINWFYWNVLNPPDLCETGSTLEDERPDVPKGPGRPRNFPPYSPPPTGR